MAFLRPGSRGVRQQLTVVAVLIVAVPLLAGVLALTQLLHRALTDSLVETLSGHVHDVATMVSTSGPREVSGLQESLTAEGFRVEVVDRATREVVYASTSRTAGSMPTLDPPAGEDELVGVRPWWTPDDDPDLVIMARRASHQGHSYVVQLATSQDSQEEAVRTTGLILLAGVPFLMVVSGLSAWWIVGRSLRPVAEIRSRVDRISSARLHDRVPVPPNDDEIAQLARTMNAMLTRLEAGQTAQRRFVADASHELRSPLATLRASIEVAQTDPSGQTWSGLGELMDSETTRLAHLVDDLLLLSKSDDRGIMLGEEDVDLDDILEQEAKRLNEIRDHKVILDITPVRVRGDQRRLVQVVRNLADNAARHGRTRIALRVKEIDGWAVLQVDDDGQGVPAEDRERIFDRFVRLDASRSRDSGGSGLGLAIVREIVQAHGGTVVAGESPWGGARFEVRLPSGESE